MIFFKGIESRLLQNWDFPDDTPRFAEVEQCRRMFQRMHFSMLRGTEGEYDRNYQRYVACVEHFNARVLLSFEEFRNVVATIVRLYDKLMKEEYKARREKYLDAIGKFERLIYLYSNKIYSNQPVEP